MRRCIQNSQQSAVCKTGTLDLPGFLGKKNATCVHLLTQKHTVLSPTLTPQSLLVRDELQGEPTLFRTNPAFPLALKMVEREYFRGSLKPEQSSFGDGCLSMVWGLGEQWVRVSWLSPSSSRCHFLPPPQASLDACSWG